MADAEAEVLRIRARIAAAQRARSRAEMERDANQATADKARDQLAAFGVSTVEQARVMLAKLQAERDAAVADVAAMLDDIGV